MAGLDSICFEPEVLYSRQLIDHIFTDPRNLGWVVTTSQDGEELLEGFIVIQVGEGAGLVITLDVDPGRRREGVATRLMDTAERFLVEEGHRTCRLQVGTTNTAALSLYEERGYLITGELPGYYANGDSAFEMEKRLGR